jgi:hypothetical protein
MSAHPTAAILQNHVFDSSSYKDKQYQVPPYQAICSVLLWDLCSIDVNVASCMLRSSRVQEAERHTLDTILLIPVEDRGDSLAGSLNYMF